jgi:molybdopterin synthase catalytic subunit
VTVKVTAEPLDPWAEVSTYQQEQPSLAGQFGATAIFVGTMRNLNEGEVVRSMTLEHYPGMTEKYLEKVSTEAAGRWAILDSLVVHRVGGLQPDDPIVVVAVWSAHRASAFDACRFIIDELKTRAPFWKQETTAHGQRWVEKNT